MERLDHLPAFVSTKDAINVDVIPGPLGIVLDASIPAKAVIEKFGPLPNGTKGMIEQTAKITIGSILVAINGKDVSQFSLRETSEVLRAAKDLKKVLTFVPPLTSPTLASTSPLPSPNKTSSISPVALPQSPAKGNNTGTSFEKILARDPYHDLGAQPLAPLAVSQLPKSSPSDGILVLEEPQGSTSNGHSANNDDKEKEKCNVQVIVPPGPLGMLLDGDNFDQAVIVGFQLLPDKSQSVLERHTEIVPGSVLISINDMDVTQETRDEVTSKLAALAQTKRKLVFRVPNFVIKNLKLRRKEEFTIIKKTDSTKLNRQECWFLIDAEWVNNWVRFSTLQDGSLPGIIHNEKLLQNGWEERLNGTEMGDPDIPLPNLKVATDYRCLTPTVWALFVQLHGKSACPPLARYTMNIYDPPVPAKEVEIFLKSPKLQAEVVAKDIKDRCRGGI